MDAMTTATQNLVVAFNGNTKAQTTVAGEVTSLTYTGQKSVVINPGACRLVNICVVQSSTTGKVKCYNSQTLTALPDNSLLYVLPPGASQGVIPVGLNFSNGLCIIVDDGVAVNCSYSIASSQ